MDRRPVGVFDSGLGGISVLGEMLDVLPEENFVYYGDTRNVPYGDKRPEEVLRLTHLAVDKLIAMDCKAVVIACNTATSAAAGPLRQELHMPVIGMEPALKPASLLPGDGYVVVMATHMTLTQPKFQRLMERYKLDEQALALPPYDLLQAIGAKRGMLISGGEVDTERAAKMLVGEFRASKWGRISLERPPQRAEVTDWEGDDADEDEQ